MKIKHMIPGMLIMILLTGCGKDPELLKFKTEIDDFCTSISELDTSINNIDVQSDNYTTELLGYLDELNTEFQQFAQVDFPKEFDYLENLADEAGDYMNEAVENYHQAYGSGSYSKATADYALQNYSRAYKRIQIIITFLHGDQPEDVDLNVE